MLLKSKHNIIILILVFCVLLFFFFVTGKEAATASPIIGRDIGDKTPNFILSDLEGNEVSLEELRKDKIIVLNIWATWCQACVRLGIPEVTTLYKQYNNKDVVFVGICLQENARRVKSFIKSYNTRKNEDKKIKYLMLLDTKAELAFHFRPRPVSIPAYIIIDKKGIIRYNDVKQYFIDFDKILDMLIAESKSTEKK